MFKDYYAILEVGENATQEELKAAFKKQAFKWHPDRNLGKDTIKQMQEINEAYLILKDNEARERYNREYHRFKQYQQQKAKQEYYHNQQNEKKNEQSYENTDYKVDDDILNNWMNTAKQQAVDLARQTIEDMKGMVSVGIKAAAITAGNLIIYQIIFGIVILLIMAMTKSCNS